MSEPQSPPPPPAQPPTQPPSGPPAQKKGLSPIAWVLIGCLGLLLILGLGMGACGLFVGKKVKNFAEEMQENPGRTAAEMVVRLNPDLEIVETDDDEETITIRSKETGEEMTLDWSEIREGNFGFTTDEGEFRMETSGEGDDAVITMTGKDGDKTQVFSAGGDAELPEWIPLAPGATDVQSAYSMQEDDTTSGAFSYSTPRSIADVASFYAEELEDDGFEVRRSSYSAAGQDSASVSGTLEDGSRSINVTVAEQDGVTNVVVNFTDGG